MKRAPIVIAGTVVGIIGVLEFHTTPAKVTLPAGSTLPAASASGPAATAGPSPTSSPSPPGSSVGSAASSPPAGKRTAVGPEVNYNYGVISVRVTVSGRKIVAVSIASLNDGSNPRSQFIDQQSIPLLEQQALQAQSANIQGVSGASYTSQGFAQSLQAALSSLGLA
jgi:uncharacterized protein with FMN-binding domain